MPRGIHMLGRKFSKKTCLRISRALKGKMPKNIKMLTSPRGKDKWNWKGDNAGYTAIHDWIKKVLGTPKKCSHCGTTKAKKFEWANISGQYKRNIRDWKRVCTSCHLKYYRTPTIVFKKVYKNKHLRYARI